MKRLRQASVIGQPNVAVNQQIDNELPAPHQVSAFPPIETSEAQHGERMDVRAPGTSGGSHSPLEALENATGPRTSEGKKTASRNAWRGGERPALRELLRVLRTADRLSH